MLIGINTSEKSEENAGNCLLSNNCDEISQLFQRFYCEILTVAGRVSFETSFDSKQPKL